MKIQAILSTLLLSACATSQIMPIQPEERGIEHVVDKSFQLGQRKSVYVGEAMVRLKDYYAHRVVEAAVEPNVDFSMEGSNLNGTGMHVILTGKKGNSYPVSGIADLEGQKLYVVQVPGRNVAANIDVAGCMPCALFDVNTGAPIAKGIFGNGYFTPGDGFTRITPSSLRMSRSNSESISAEKGYINQEIIYSGLAGGAIRLSYREYSKEDLARPAFYQELTYDLNSQFIRFRNIRIQVHSATNEGISYTVVEDGH